MGNLSLYRKGIAYLFFYLAVGLLLLSACAAPSTSQLKSDESKVPVIESIKVQPSPDQTIVEIISSKATPYTTFELMDPPRIILDIRGVLGEDLKRNTEVNDGNVEEIRFEKGVAEAMTTRVVVSLARAVDHQVSEWDNVLTLTLTPKEAPTVTVEPPESQKEMGSQEMENAKKAERTPAEPRIFFKPRPITLNQVLGVDYSMLKTGKSRLTVTADKKVRYQLEREGPKSLLLTLEEATIPPLLMRRLDSSYFEGTVDRVKASFSSADKRVSLAISLREMVPFHIKQKDAVITMEFGRTSIKPPDLKIFPVKVSEKEIVKTSTSEQAGGTTPPPEEAGGTTPPPEQAAGVPGLPGKKYTGEPMTMDFVNADITSILRLIAEISNLNIIWGPQVTGTVSMRLRNVPWDQALDLLLDNNKLAQRRRGNVIWITTKAEMSQIEAEERQKHQEIAENKRIEMEARLAEEKSEP
ncbi:MAG: AMIN domain-containing protein, partial [Desulfatiglandales bacterium]